jgi:hypothetical protein
MYKILGGDGKEYGPVTAEQIRQWVRENRLNGQSMAQGADSTEWKPVSSFPEFAPLFAPSSSPPPIPADVAPLAATTAPTARPEIPTYLVPAILCTLFCCLPFGVPAIVYSAQVSSKQAAGDIAGAQTASKNARTWCWVAFGVGVIWTIVVGLVATAMFAKVGTQQRPF